MSRKGLDVREDIQKNVASNSTTFNVYKHENPIMGDKTKNLENQAQTQETWKEFQKRYKGFVGNIPKENEQNIDVESNAQTKSQDNISSTSTFQTDSKEDDTSDVFLKVDVKYVMKVKQRISDLRGPSNISKDLKVHYGNIQVRLDKVLEERNIWPYKGKKPKFDALVTYPQNANDAIKDAIALLQSDVNANRYDRVKSELKRYGDELDRQTKEN